jgi:pimeloyl-ACP methyl ester carboxylesterase
MQVSRVAPVALCAAALLAPACSSVAERADAPERRARAADGLDLAYEVRGDGLPALVFVHGWCGERSQWRTTMEAFEDHHRVLAPDLGGHGASGAERAQWTLPALAGDVLAVCDQEALSDLILVGHSMGAPVALLAAARMHGRVRGVIAVDSLHDVDFAYPDGFLEEIASGLERDYSGVLEASFRSVTGTGLAPERLEWLMARAARTERAAAIGLLRGLEGFDLRAAMGAAGVPVRALHVERAGGPATALERNRLVADFEALPLEGSSHFPMLEDPARFVAQLARWVESLSAQPLPQ